MKLRKENSKEFEELCREMWNHFQPKGRAVRRIFYAGTTMRPNFALMNRVQLHAYLAESPGVEESIINGKITELESAKVEIVEKDQLPQHMRRCLEEEIKDQADFIPEAGNVAEWKLNLLGLIDSKMELY